MIICICLASLLSSAVLPFAVIAVLYLLVLAGLVLAMVLLRSCRNCLSGSLSLSSRINMLDFQEEDRDCSFLRSLGLIHLRPIDCLCSALAVAA